MKNTIKKIFLSTLFLGSLVYVSAQPTVSAPLPTHDAADVISLFSNHYTTTSKGVEPTTWGGDNAITEITIEGTNDKILSTAGNSFVANTSGWRGQTKGYIHLDVWSESGGSFSFGLGADFNGNIKYPQNFQWPTLKAGQWNSIDVPVIEYVKAGLNDALNLQQIRFVGKGRYYIDNIYAYGPKEQFVEMANIPVAPTPMHPSGDVISAFSDTYIRATKEDPVAVSYAGSSLAKIMSYKDKQNESVLKLEKLGTSGVNISIWKIINCNYLHVDVYFTGNNGDGTFEFGLNSNDWGGKDFKYMNDFTWPKAIAGQWVSMDIPLAKFKGMSGLTLNGLIMMQFKGSGEFYIDNLYAYQTPLEVKIPTTVPTFNLEANNVKSIFCEQYEDPGYQESELGMTDTDSNGNPMYYGQNAKQVREFVEIVAGNKSIKLTSWDVYPFKIHKNSTGMDLSDMDYLHVSVYLMSGLDETSKPSSITFWMHDKNLKQLTNVPSVEMQTGQWVSVSIPLCHFGNGGLDLTEAYVLRLRQGGYPSMDVYVDNIFAYRGEPIGFVAGKCEDVVVKEPIFDKTDGTLPPANRAFLGVNLASASGGTVPGTLGTNYAMPKNEDLWYFKAKGVRLVRFPFRWKRIQSYLGGPLVDKDISAMKQVVREAERLGIWVMLDMHDYAEYNLNDTAFTTDGRYRTKNENGFWGPWKTADGVNQRDLRVDYADVWVKLAQEFKDFSNIWGYDLMNEPKDVDIKGLKDGYQLVINEIRKVDTKTAIVVEGKNYAGAQGWPGHSDLLKELTDPSDNIIYQAHTYFDNDNSGTYNEKYDTEIGTNSEIYKQRLDPFVNWLKENNKRGMLGEFGVPYNGKDDKSDERYMVLIDKVFAYLKEKQLTATYWCAGNWYETNHLTVQPAKDYYTEKSTMLVMEKYTWNFDKETSIDSPSLKNNKVISIYPIPVKNKLTIEAKENISSIRIFNIYGQTIFEQKLNGNETKCEVDFSQYLNGNYLLQVDLPHGNFAVQKVTK